jgi:hypothetical protein
MPRKNFKTLLNWTTQPLNDMKNKDNNKETTSPLAKKLEDFALRPDDNAWEQFQALRQTQPTRRPHYGNRRWLFGVGLMVFFFSACLFATLITFDIDLFGSQKTPPSVNSAVGVQSNEAELAAALSVTAPELSLTKSPNLSETVQPSLNESNESNKTKLFNNGTYLNSNKTITFNTGNSKSSDATSKSSDSTSKSSGSTSKSSDSTSKSSDSASKSSDATSKSSDTTSKSSDATSKSSDATSKSSDATSKSSDATSKSSDATSKSSDATSKSLSTASAMPKDDDKKTQDGDKNDVFDVKTNENTDKSTVEAIVASEMSPLSILSVENGVSSFAGNLPPALPTLKKQFKPTMRNEIGVGLGISLIQIGVPQHSIVSLGYFRRFTPLMALGATFGYSNDGKKGYTAALEAQLNFTLMRRPNFGLYLTTGYGFRNWDLPESRGSTKGGGKGVTIGMEGRYFFSKHYFTGLRVDMKETNYSNFGVQVQIGKLF